MGEFEHFHPGTLATHTNDEPDGFVGDFLLTTRQKFGMFGRLHADEPTASPTL